MRSLFQRLIAYFKYRYKAVNAHGLHSPFLFGLYYEVIKFKNSAQESELKRLRKRMLNLQGKINYSDPKTDQTKTIHLKQFAKKSASTHRFSIFLVRLIDHLKYKNVLETGTCTGVNTAYLASSTAEQVCSIEGAPEIARVAQQSLQGHGLSQVEIIAGKVQEVFAPTLVQLKPNLIFLDADHRAQTIDFYLSQIKVHHPKTSCIIIHDIHWSADMENAWKKIIENESYNLTIDIFHAGIIFPHYPMTKQHFVIKF